MKLIVVAIFDRAAGVYSHPLFLPSAAVAQRSFRDLLMDPQSVQSKHPTDYSLHLLAEYDDQTGFFSETGSPTCMLTGATVAALIKEREAANERLRSLEEPEKPGGTG